MQSISFTTTVLTIICLVYRCRCYAFLMSNPCRTHRPIPSCCSVHRHRTTISMGLEVKIRTVGRKNGGEQWLESAYTTYNTRLKSTNLSVSTQYHKNDDELIKGIEADESKNHKVVLLDPIGKMCTSEVFADDMYRWLEEGGSRLTFVIGGAEGLPMEVRNGKRDLLSLGMMTFTHQFARILLVEQVYRASEIKKGSNYHKWMDDVELCTLFTPDVTAAGLLQWLKLYNTLGIFASALIGLPPRSREKRRNRNVQRSQCRCKPQLCIISFSELQILRSEINCKPNPLVHTFARIMRSLVSEHVPNAFPNPWSGYVMEIR